MSMISVDSHRLVIDEELSRPASRDPWAPPSSLFPRDYESREASEKETCEIGIQCELPIQVPKPASADAFTQCCNIGKTNHKRLLLHFYTGTKSTQYVEFCPLIFRLHT